jgi:hypothetical protein
MGLERRQTCHILIFPRTHAINSPVCVIKDDMVYCESGYADGLFSYKHPITWQEAISQ